MQGSSIVDLIGFHLGGSHCFHLTEQPIESVLGLATTQPVTSASMASESSLVVACLGSRGESSRRPRYTTIPAASSS